MQIGIIYGGKGAEEFVNIIALRQIENVLDHYQINFVRIYLNDRNLKLNKLKEIDLFIVIDSNCKNLRKREEIFNYIKKRSIPIVKQNESAYYLARDKSRSNTLFRNNGLSTTKPIYINSQNINFPIIVKDNFGSSSENLYYCKNKREAIFAIQSVKKYCRKVLIEEYLKGKEVTIPFVKIFNRELVLEPIELIYKSPIYDYNIKNRNFRIKLNLPAKVNAKVKNKIIKTTKIANKIINVSHYSRLDVKIKNKKIYIIEINGEPTLCINDFMAKSAKYMGISYPKLIIGMLSNFDKFVKYAKIYNPKLYKLILAGQKIVEGIKDL